MNETVLITGGTGKTGIRIANKLVTLSIPVLLTSRKGQFGVPIGLPVKAVVFDWYDETTYINPFTEDKNIDVVYIVVPPVVDGRDVAEVTKTFINFAWMRGVKKFVLLSSVNSEKGAPSPHGHLHAYLDTSGLDYAVLRPSWFFSNFIFSDSIREKDEVISAAAEGKTSFVSEDDIADIAVEFLTASKLGRVERILLGPELLSYQDIADQLSRVLGRTITYRNISVEERQAEYMNRGVQERLALALATREAKFVATGGEAERVNSPNAVLGKTRFIEFAEKNKAVWMR